jgi:predicted DsbA family dithiol-disulfide isomerase
MSEQRDSERIIVYSDYVCPFCYLGRASLEQYQSGREDGTIDHALEGSEDYGTWLAFDEAVLDALWRDGRDIGSADDSAGNRRPSGCLTTR